MKKLFAVFMVLVVVFSFSLNAFANEKTEGEVLTDQEFGFSVYEYTDPEHQIVRTYVRNENSVKVGNSRVLESETYASTKQLLLALGMEEDNVMQMSNKRLEKYANAKNITSVTTYTKNDADGNIIVVSEDEAMKEVARAGVGARSYPEINNTETASSQDAYMRISLFTTYLGNGNYYFSADAKWLNMPSYRSADSFGFALNGHVVNIDSCFAWIEYDRIPYSILGNKYYHEAEGLLSSSYFYPVSGNWGGFAAAFDLKNDWLMGDSYANYEVHIEMDTVIEYPSQALNFNVIATYHHSEKTVNISGVSIGLDSSGTVGMSIGIEMDNKYTRRYAYSGTPYSYTP